tara:strand:- start:11008 stop:11178 length:171 start_codon:yes stop_codon:yes gene_type:complete
MKLLDYILFSLSVAFLVMGIYEVMVVGISQAYSFIMISVTLLFVFWYRKSQREQKK